MRSASRLGLGTAQFGLDYGITNREGKLTAETVGRILAFAARNGVDTLDTACLYGDSEDAIGRNRPINVAFRVVTKTPKFNGIDDAETAVSLLRTAFGASLERLRQPAVHGLLIHDATDLLGPLGSALWHTLEREKAEGRTAKIGVSVYCGGEIDALLGKFAPDLIQLPWNPIDHRLVEGGQIGALADRGVEIHARSLFLQGLLLQPSNSIPERFAPVAHAVAELDALGARFGLNRLETIMAAAMGQPEIGHFICGVTSVEELHAILLAGEKGAGIKGDICFPKFRGIDPRYLNPARWGELG